MYLRCLTGDRPRQWLQWLPWAEFCYNTPFQSSLGTSPFQVVYGRDPPSLHAYIPGESRLPAVDQQLLDQDEFLLEVGQWVWLRLLHRQAASLDIRGRGKLALDIMVPFRLQNASVMLLIAWPYQRHDVFHVGLLKTFRGTPLETIPQLPPLHHGCTCPERVAILKARLVCGQHELLVH